MKNLLIFMIFINIFLFSNLILAETEKTTIPPQPQLVEDTAEEKVLKEHKNESELYKQLYENSERSNDRIITIMQWSIGLAATFIIVLLGSQILFNYRVNKEEIRAIRSKLEEKFSNLRSEIIESINRDSKKSADFIQQSFNILEKELQDNFVTQFREKEKYFDVKIESVGKDNKLLKSIFESKVNALSIELNKLDGYVWQLRGVRANALKQFVKIAELKIDQGDEPKYILSDIKNVLDDMKAINKSDYAQLENLMGKIPANFNQIKDEIESLYKALPQYMFIEDPEKPGELKTVYI
ncbi:MAG: hypothetical protein P9L89_08370 [Candidatus Celaenobacter polaris]|nr:hypothetical protein [Candidatus Celaenobacter polaris]